MKFLISYSGVSGFRGFGVSDDLSNFAMEVFG